MLALILALVLASLVKTRLKTLLLAPPDLIVTVTLLTFFQENVILLLSSDLFSTIESPKSETL